MSPSQGHTAKPGIETRPFALESEPCPPGASERLSSAERRHLATLTVEKRRRDWTLGRLAAKRAVRAALGPSAPGEAAIAILADESGAPRPFLERDGALVPLDLELSLSHGHGLAAAWAAREGFPGIDLERVRPRNEGTLRFYLTQEERALVLARPAGPARDEAAVLLWSIKEAAWKALRPGRGAGLLDVRVVSPEPLALPGALQVVFSGSLEPRARELGAAVEASFSFSREGDVVLAWGLVARPARSPGMVSPKRGE